MRSGGTIGVRAVLGALVAVSAMGIGACGSEDLAGPGSTVAERPAVEPRDDLIACERGGPTFPRAALETLGDAVAPDAAMTAAVQTFLQSEEGPYWPQEGWRVLSADADSAVLFVEADGGFWFQLLERRDGAWDWQGSIGKTDCRLRVPPPDGFSTVEWILDPEADPPGPGSDEVTVLVTERACASGQPVGDRLSEPRIEVTADTVRLGFVARAMGEATCPGNPSTRVVVQLPEPLGDRELVDAYDLQSSLADHL